MSRASIARAKVIDHRDPGRIRYERSEARRDTRAGHYERKLETKAGEVKLRIPMHLDQSFLDRTLTPTVSLNDGRLECLRPKRCAVHSRSASAIHAGLS
jgi:hypothetical protein